MKNWLKFLGVILFFIGILLFVIPLTGFSINGAVIGVSEIIPQDYFILAGAVLLVFSIMILTSESGLEKITSEENRTAIVIPTGDEEANKIRAEAAVNKCRQISQDEKPYLFITGKLSKNDLGKIKPDAEVRDIYTVLRQEGEIKPSEMILEKESKDTLENFLYSLKKFEEKGINKIYLATNPLHYARFKMFEQEAKKQGYLDKSFEMIPIYTKETIGEKLYGIAAYLKDYIKLRLNNPFKREK